MKEIFAPSEFDEVCQVIPRNTFALEFDRRVEDVFYRVKQQPFWLAITSTETSPVFLRRMFREVLLSVYYYQRHTTEAGFHMLGRLPKGEVKLLKSLLAHKAEEAEHGNWALRDYIALGGSEEIAKGVPSPATFAVASVWWRMAMVEDPIGYLGAEHLFEYLTEMACKELVLAIEKRQFPKDRIGFVVEHATEDAKHARLIRYWISNCGNKYPDSVGAMRRCFDYFEEVYPLPVWNEAFKRACNADSDGSLR